MGFFECGGSIFPCFPCMAVCMHVSMIRFSYSEVATNLGPPSHLSRRGYVSVLVKVPWCFVLHSLALLDLNLLVLKIIMADFQIPALGGKACVDLVPYRGGGLIIWFCSF